MLRFLKKNKNQQLNHQINDGRVPPATPSVCGHSLLSCSRYRYFQGMLRHCWGRAKIYTPSVLKLNILAVLGMVSVLSACDAPTPFPATEQQLQIIIRTGPLTYDETPLHAGDNPTGINGLEYELTKAFGQFVGQDVEYVVVKPENLLSALRQEKGHFAAAWLSPPTDATNQFIAGPPIAESRDVLVYELGQLPINQLAQLTGRTIHAIAGSRQAQTLKTLQADIPELAVKEVAGTDAIKLLEAISNQQIEIALIDSATLNIGLNYYPNLTMGLAVGKPYPITWLFPQNSDPNLIAKVTEFVQSIKENGILKRLLDRYFGHLDRLGNYDNSIFIQRISSVLPLYKNDFIQAQEETGIDWRLIAALAYQESGWDPLATSHTNVRGMMMLTEDTAEHLGVSNRLDAKQSIRAGARYLDQLRKQLPDSSTEPDRTWLAIAAYNLGPGNFKQSRSFAKANHLNPDDWFDMKKALPMFARVSRARGGEAVIMVEKIRLLYSTLQRFEPPHVPDTTFFGISKSNKKASKNKAPTLNKKRGS